MAVTVVVVVMVVVLLLMVMVNGVGRRLESEVVCGKCDARRLAASIGPHVHHRRRRRHRRCRRRAPRVQTRACGRYAYTHSRASCLTHAARRGLLSWAKPRSVHTLIPATAGLSPVPALPVAAAAQAPFSPLKPLAPPPQSYISPSLSRRRVPEGLGNRMTSRDLAPLSLR